MLLLHPPSTCVDDLQQLALVFFSPAASANTLSALVAATPATCAGGLFPNSMHLCIYCMHILQLALWWWWYIILCVCGRCMHVARQFL